MVTLATCGCQVAKFVCVSCKKQHTSHYYMLPIYLPTLNVLPEHQLLPVNVPNHLPAYRLFDTVYCVFKECTSISGVFSPEMSERSMWCAKLVLSPGGYICGSCKISSIDKLCTLSEVDSCLRMLLELDT